MPDSTLERPQSALPLPAELPSTPPSRLEAFAASATQLNTKYRWIILIGLILGAVMEILDTTIINVALPQMAGNLGATTQEIAWVSTSYILANVVLLPMTAFLTLRFGRRNYLTASILLFTLASFFCGTSHSLTEMIVWRLIQGAAGAALISTAQATLVQIFPPEEQGIVQPLFLMGLVVAPTVGPTLGGWITDAASWNWCFFLNVPLGILAAGIVFSLLRDTEKSRGDDPIDWPGIILLTTGLAGLQYVLEEGQQNDWFSDVWITRVAIVAALSLIAMVFWLLSPRNTHPVVDLRVLRNGSLSAGIVLFIVVGFGLYGVTYLYPLLAQTVEGLTSLQTGLALLPGGFATAVSIVFCGVIASNPKSKIDPRMLTLIGVACSVTAMWALAHLSSQSRVGDTFWPLLIRGASIGFLMIPVNYLALGSLKPNEVTQGTGLLGLARQLGGSLGIALLATYLNANIHMNRSNMVSYINSNSNAYNQTTSQLTGSLAMRGYSHVEAAHGALGIVNQMLNMQVFTKSFNDTFLLLMIISIVTIPCLFLLRKPNAGAISAPVH